MEEENIKEESISKEEYLKLKRSNNKKKAIIIILIFTMILVCSLVIIFLCCGKCYKPKENVSVENNENEKYENTFKYDAAGSYGIAYVTGYAKVTTRPYCGAIGDECTEQNAISVNDEVDFYITKNDSEDLNKEINSWYGELYDGDKTISLGCVKNGTISYYNAADEFQESSEIAYGNNFKIFTLDSNESDSIVNSNENNPIVLKLTKLKLTNGGEAPACYSNFAYVEVIE